MRYKSRIERRDDSFDKQFDLIITPILVANLFVEKHPYFFIREHSSSKDVIYFDIEGKTMMLCFSHKPFQMKEIDELYYWYEPEALGSFSYLSPQGISNYNYTCEYPIKKAPERDQSLIKISEGIKNHLLPRLDLLQNFENYLKYLNKDMLMYYARANEVMGNLVQALNLYEEVYRRFIAGVMLYKNTNAYLKSLKSKECLKLDPYAGRIGVYLTRKLQRDIELGNEISNKINFDPPVTQIVNAANTK